MTTPGSGPDMGLSMQASACATPQGTEDYSSLCFSLCKERAGVRAGCVFDRILVVRRREMSAESAGTHSRGADRLREWTALESQN